MRYDVPEVPVNKLLRRFLLVVRRGASSSLANGISTLGAGEQPQRTPEGFVVVTAESPSTGVHTRPPHPVSKRSFCSGAHSIIVGPRSFDEVTIPSRFGVRFVDDVSETNSGSIGSVGAGFGSLSTFY
ncbi:hypothetical protein GW17_00051485 [Ensete ventricosum]|nr:hypothetical protein GW17_00051485 [Ensete ventricosum]